MNDKIENRKAEIKQLGILILIISAILYGMYLFTINFVVNENSSVDENKANYILATESFLLDEFRYYVLYIDMDDYTSKKIYEDLIKDKLTYPLYIVDLSVDANKKVLSSESNEFADNYNELKIDETTLIEIEKQKVISYIKGINEIVKKTN